MKQGFPTCEHSSSAFHLGDFVNFSVQYLLGFVYKFYMFYKFLMFLMLP